MIQPLLEWSEEEQEVHLAPLSLPTRTQPGDVWSLGRHTLYCGSSEDQDHVERQVRTHGPATLVFTDPPYQMDELHGSKTSFVGMGGEERPMRPVHKKISDMGIGKFDPVTFLDLLPLYFEHGTIAAFVFHSKNNGPDYGAWIDAERKGRERLTIGERGQAQIVNHHLKGMAFTQLVWYKGDKPDEDDLKATANPFPIGGAHRPDSELFFYIRKRGKWNDGKKAPFAQRGRVVFHKKVKGEHPTIKPVSLIVNQLLLTTEPNDLVYDPYGGSGSTLIACEETGRKCVMTELLPRFCDLIVSRWEGQSGKRAERIA